jgi:outer membrane receptor protein involved in Fe transport
MHVKLLLTAINLLFCQLIFAQDQQISGTVTFTDSLKTSCGARVSVKGTNIGTSTDEAGKYTLSVPESASVLVFSFVGMKTMEEKIEGKSVINVTLMDDLLQLETAVITALGLKGERDKLASSISTLKGTAIAQSGETGVLNGLSGKVAGVVITRSGGDPGAGSYIQIRGQNTINGNAQPLFIVDGTPVSNSSDNK